MKPGGAIRFEAYDELSYRTREKKECSAKATVGTRDCSQLLVACTIVAGLCIIQPYHCDKLTRYESDCNRTYRKQLLQCTSLSRFTIAAS